jgi:transaldolase
VEALAKNAQETEELIDKFRNKPWYDSDKVAFKVPISKDGLEATKNIKRKDPSIKMNLHMAFSAAQASLAMLAKPDYIAPLIGRYADKVAELNAHGKRAHGNDAGYEMLEGIMTCKRAMNSDSIILASSIRTVHDFVVATKLGADAVTLPPAILREALEHPMTAEGVKKFWEDLN